MEEQTNPAGGDKTQLDFKNGAFIKTVVDITEASRAVEVLGPYLAQLETQSQPLPTALGSDTLHQASLIVLARAV